jgi:hypothetical protein
VIALWLTVCVAGSCHTIPLQPDPAAGLASAPIEQPFSTIGCLTGAPAIIAAWQQRHRRWNVTGWRCGPEEKGA